MAAEVVRADDVADVGGLRDPVLSQRSAMPSVSKCVAISATRVTNVCSAVMRRPASCTRMDPLSSVRVSRRYGDCGWGGVPRRSTMSYSERMDRSRAISRVCTKCGWTSWMRESARAAMSSSAGESVG